MMRPTATKSDRRSAATEFDVTAYLKTPEDVAGFLDAWLEEAPDDAAGIARALGEIARARGMTRVAKDAGLSRESLYRSLSQEGNPSLATVLKVLGALGVRLRAAPAYASPTHAPATPAATSRASEDPR